MPTRAYRPDFSGRLEGRMLLSAAGAGAGRPYVFHPSESRLVVSIISRSFTVFARNHDHVTLESDLDDVVAIIPFSRADGLPEKFDGIVNKMIHDIRANVPNAIRTAANDANAVARADLGARVQSGDVVIK